jgi:hypothetical protein
MPVRRLLFLLFLLLALPLRGQGVPTPASHFGFEPGTDRKLANWTELLGYYEKLARSSPRVKLDTLGTTTLGRPFVMLTVTSPENQARLAELREVQMKLSDPRKVSGPEELKRLLERGKTVVLITQQIHSTEVGAGQMAPRLLHRLAASGEPRVREILENVVLLHVPSLNPDGTEMVSNWYRRWVGTPHEAAPLPALYHPYVGHDNNRDWYAFTQKETQLAITKAHNAWHPQIVHDVHQMGSLGARIFAPPYVDPVEPNVDPLLVAAVNQLGAYMAAEMISEGKRGVVVNAQYDMYTPARAYQHYHGGARILTETASARLATPLVLKKEDLRSARGFDVHRMSWNFPAPWEGGEWGLPQIVDYMESGAMALLTNAARNRRFWLENFYRVGERAVNRWPEWPEAWVIPAGQGSDKGVQAALRILRMGDVEVHRAEAPFTAGGRSFPAGSWVIPMSQPYAAFAQTLLERQDYPRMLQYPGGPPVRPYDVTAHTLPLLMGFEAVPLREPVRARLSGVIPTPPAEIRYETPAAFRGKGAPRIAIYKSWDEPMPEGWTRWMLDRHGIAYDTLHDADVKRGGLARRYDVILLQDQPARSLREGYSREEMPEPYAGGLGEEGTAALRDFVQGGGRLVAVEEATDFAVEALDLGVRSAVAGLKPQEFYVPGSILRLRPEGEHPLTRGVEREGIAWYWGSSRAFEVRDPAARVLARYGEGDPLLSGWILGPEHVAGRPALVEARVGRGSVVLFGFQPDYRGQSIATWPLLFNALAYRR